MHPGAEDLYGEGQLLSVIDRIREYVRSDEPTQGYIDRGIERFGLLLSKHAAFDAWLAERRSA